MWVHVKGQKIITKDFCSKQNDLWNFYFMLVRGHFLPILDVFFHVEGTVLA